MTAASASAARAHKGSLSRPASLHHTGWVVADQERNRHFMEDLLGLRLVATFTDESSINAGLKFSHTMYELGDGNTLAFFQMVGPGSEEIQPDRPNRFNHVALRSDLRTQQEIHDRLLAAGYEHFIQDHGWVVSLYATSPDGLNLEIAADTPQVHDVMEKRAVDPHGDLERWLAGDHTGNSDPVENPEPIRRFPGTGGTPSEPPVHAEF